MHATLLAVSLAVAATLVPASSAACQTTYLYSPPNATTNAGGTNNNAPFYAVSSTYQQIHEPASMGKAVTLKGMAFRNWGARTVAARNWDMRITMSHTKVDPYTATATFSTNLGSVNTTVVFGSATGWTTFKFAGYTSTGTVNPPAFTIPFASPYNYISPLGNLCWEWRHWNGTSTASMPMDASSASGHLGTVGSPTGTGCTATGRSSPAGAAVSTTLQGNGSYPFQLDLTNGGASATAVAAFGLTKSPVNVGWCANLEVTPLLLLFGQTDAQGAWRLQLPLQALAGTPAIDLHAQFAFSDNGLPAGIGLSNLASYKTPVIPGVHGMGRIYTRNTSANGDETATSGNIFGRGFGLVVGWLQ